MEVKFFLHGTMDEKQINDVSELNHYLSNPSDPDVDMYDWADPAYGKFLLLDEKNVVGKVSIHKTETEYCGQRFYLGGFGGLVVRSEYRNHGYGRILAEEAIKKLEQIGVDVACMCVDMESGITNFYERLGYRFLNRPAYFISWEEKEKTDNTVMILGICNKALAEKILNTHGKFHYGQDRGHW